MGYPLPSAPWDGTYEYYIVAIPGGDPAYRRAAYDLLNSPANVWEWGKEGVVDPGSWDARQAWLQAVNETWRLLEMGWPDRMESHIDDVETLLRALNELDICCGNAKPVMQTHDTGVTESVDPVPGTIQANYGVGDDWDAAHTEYICPALRQFWLAQDTELLDPLGDMLDIGLITLNVLVNVWVAVFSIGTAVVLGGVSLGTWIALLAALKDSGSGVALGDYSTLDDYADEFVCTVIAADGPEAKASAVDAWIDGLPFNTLVKMILRVAMTPTTFSNIYQGKTGQGDDIVLADNSGGCPTCGGTDTGYTINVVYGTLVSGGPVGEEDHIYTDTDYVVRSQNADAVEQCRIQTLLNGSVADDLIISNTAMVQVLGSYTPRSGSANQAAFKSGESEIPAGPGEVPVIPYTYTGRFGTAYVNGHDSPDQQYEITFRFAL